MRIYFDNCCLQRPLDDKSQLRIRLESEAILAILDLCEKGTVAIISSEVLEIELSRTPHPQRKAYVDMMGNRIVHKCGAPLMSDKFR